MRVVTTARQAGDQLLLLLPDAPAGHGALVHWWHFREATLLDQGQGDGWLALAAGRDADIIGLAPTTSLRMVFPELPSGGQDRQRLAVARLAATDRLLADPATVHAVAAIQAGLSGGAVVAVAGNDRILGWLDWAERLNVRLDHIVPAAMVLPLGSHWVGAAVGNDRMIGKDGAVIPDEPDLKDALVDDPVEAMEQDAVIGALARLAANPRPDLRSGRFARRRIMIDPAQWKLIGSLAAAIVLVTVLTAIIQVLKLDSATSRLNAETLEIARKVAGPSTTIETAEAAVARRAGTSGGPVSTSVAGLLARLANQPGIALASLASSPGGVTASLSAPSPQSANFIIQALQRDGYLVTSVPRQSGDGRTQVDLTIREGL